MVSDEKRRLERTDLVYTERLDYCEKVRELGIPGTKGRACSNHAPLEPDDMRSCQVFCCDRGFREALIKQKKKCRCKFEWCCDVKCDLCEEKVMTYRCR
jgi:wnt family.